MAHGKILDLLNSEKKDSGKQKKGAKGGDGWNQQIGATQQILSFGGLGNSNHYFI